MLRLKAFDNQLVRQEFQCPPTEAPGIYKDLVKEIEAVLNLSRTMNPKLGVILLFITFFSFSAAAATLERVLRTSGSPPHRPYHPHQGSSTGVKYGSGYGSYYHPRMYI